MGHLGRTLRVAVAAALLAVLVPPAVAPAVAQVNTDPRCNVIPLGAVSPATPMWCLPQPLPSGPSTLTQGPNSWADDWDHGLSNSDLGGGYAHGVVGGAEAVHWRHQDHWMVDLRAETGQFPTLAAGWMRPDRTFTPDASGTVVVEFEVAAPIAGTRDVAQLSDSWPEVVLTTATAPTSSNPWGSFMRPNGTYLYEAFPHDWVFGCRVQQSRHPICALYRPDTDGVENHAGGPDRVWEVNQNGGDVTDEFGGDPSTPGLADAWAVCASDQDPDTVCRNLFRLTLTPQRVRLDVRKPGAPGFVRYYEAGLVDANLGNILHAPGGFRVFFGDFAYRITDDTVVRFHWDRLAVNPDPTPPAPPTPTPTATTPPAPTAAGTATATVTPAATAPAVATGTPTPVATATPAPASCEVRVRIGGVEQWLPKPPEFCA